MIDWFSWKAELLRFQAGSGSSFRERNHHLVTRWNCTGPRCATVCLDLSVTAVDMLILATEQYFLIVLHCVDWEEAHERHEIKSRCDACFHSEPRTRAVPAILPANKKKDSRLRNTCGLEDWQHIHQNFMYL